jgi:hypothetical protein
MVDFGLDVVCVLSTFTSVPPSQVQRRMRHKQYGTMERYVREAQQIMEGGGGEDCTDLKARSWIMISPRMPYWE